jgi:hypothetical protein
VARQGQAVRLGAPTPHFDGYAAILVRLERIAERELEEVLTEAWLARAPSLLAKAYLDDASRR